jgi:hypothetical protein
VSVKENMIRFKIIEYKYARCECTVPWDAALIIQLNGTRSKDAALAGQCENTGYEGMVEGPAD